MKNISKSHNFKRKMKVSINEKKKLELMKKTHVISSTYFLFIHYYFSEL